MSDVLRLVKERGLRAAYSLFLRYGHTYRDLAGRNEPELAWIPRLVASRRRAVDVGANVGVYTRKLSRWFARVEAFEPLPEAADRIAGARLENVQIHRVALSDRRSEATLRVPIKAGVERLGNSSLEVAAAGRYAEVRAVPVEVRPLDDYAFEDVDFVKIDVEGHELEVLAGARETLARNRPVVLVEIEQRHMRSGKTPHDVFRALEELGFEGHFLEEGQLQRLDRFDLDAHQLRHIEAGEVRKDAKRSSRGRRETGAYVQNFFFLPR